MSNRPSTSRTPWTAGVRVWIERDARAVLGQGRADLLTAVDRTGSISAAARELGMGYRHAWTMIDTVNEAAGVELVSRAAGGARGGGARLTDAGREALALFRRFQAEVHGAAAEALPRLLGATASSTPVIHLAAAISLQEVVGQLLSAFALRRPLVPVRAIFGASNELAEYLLGGAATHVFLTADKTHLSRLHQAGMLSDPKGCVLAHNGLAVIADADQRLSAAKPRDLLDGRFRRIAVAESVSPLGACTHKLLKTAKLFDRLRDRLVTVDNSRGVLAAVRGRQADVGFAFSSDAATGEGCRTLFVADRRWGVEYVGAVLQRSEYASEARELVDFFSSSEGLAAFVRCGFRAAKRRSQLRRSSSRS